MPQTTQAALPAETDGYGTSRFNALRHGVLSRYTVLPWEDPDEHAALLAALAAEHAAQGPTEEHLVEELAGILWRKRRLCRAEAALHRRGLNRTLEPFRHTAAAALVHVDTASKPEWIADAIRNTDADTGRDVADVDEDEAMTRRAIELLGSKRNDAYEAALAALREDTRTWWADVLARDPDDLEEDEEPYTADPKSLHRFIEAEVLPCLEGRRKELAARPLIREQAFGEALEPDKLERLGRYEVHLDRKLERMLSMLLKLKELRQTASGD